MLFDNLGALLQTNPIKSICQVPKNGFLKDHSSDSSGLSNQQHVTI